MSNETQSAPINQGHIRIAEVPGGVAPEVGGDTGLIYKKPGNPGLFWNNTDGQEVELGSGGGGASNLTVAAGADIQAGQLLYLRDGVAFPYEDTWTRDTIIVDGDAIAPETCIAAGFNAVSRIAMVAYRDLNDPILTLRVTKLSNNGGVSATVVQNVYGGVDGDEVMIYHAVDRQWIMIAKRQNDPWYIWGIDVADIEGDLFVTIGAPFVTTVGSTDVSNFKATIFGSFEINRYAFISVNEPGEIVIHPFIVDGVNSFAFGTLLRDNVDFFGTLDYGIQVTGYRGNGGVYMMISLSGIHRFYMMVDEGIGVSVEIPFLIEEPGNAVLERGYLTSSYDQPKDLFYAYTLLDGRTPIPIGYQSVVDSQRRMAIHPTSIRVPGIPVDSIYSYALLKNILVCAEADFFNPRMKVVPFEYKDNTVLFRHAFIHPSLAVSIYPTSRRQIRKIATVDDRLYLLYENSSGMNRHVYLTEMLLNDFDQFIGVAAESVDADEELTVIPRGGVYTNPDGEYAVGAKYYIDVNQPQQITDVQQENVLFGTAVSFTQIKLA